MLQKMVQGVQGIARKMWYGSGSVSLLYGGDPYGSEDGQWQYDKNAWIAYQCNPISYRAVNIIADAVAGIPWRLYRKTSSGEDIEITEAPVIDLLTHPNPWLGEKEFFAQYMQYLILSGNTYIKSAGPSSGMNPKELYFLRPDRIDIINGDCGIGMCPDEFDGLIYMYTCGRTREKIDLRYFHHSRLWNPFCDFYGQSPLQPATTAIVMLNEALRWNAYLLKNNALPPGILYNEGNLSDDQVKRLKEQLAQKYQGPSNARRPMVLEGGLKWESMGHSPHDMDWLKGAQQAMNLIATCLGLDPSIMGSGEHRNYATYKDAEKSFYVSTVIPYLEKIRDGFLNNWLLPRFSGMENCFFQYDVEAVEVLSEARGEVWDRMISGIQAGLITVNEARQELGYDELKSPDQDGDEPPETAPQIDNEEETSPDKG